MKIEFRTAITVDALYINNWAIEQELAKAEIYLHCQRSLFCSTPKNFPLFHAWLIEHGAIEPDTKKVAVGIWGT